MTCDDCGNKLIKTGFWDSNLFLSKGRGLIYRCIKCDKRYFKEWDAIVEVTDEST